MLAAYQANANLTPQMQRWLEESARDGGPAGLRTWEPGSQDWVALSGPQLEPSPLQAGPGLDGSCPEKTEIGNKDHLLLPLRQYLTAAKDNDNDSCVYQKIRKFAAEPVEDLDPRQQGLRNATNHSTNASVCNPSSECQCLTHDQYPHTHNYLEETLGSTTLVHLESLQNP